MKRKKDKMDKRFIFGHKYREILDKTAVCTVDVVIFNKDMSETLLFRRKNLPLKGCYFSIGGRLYKNEKLDDCAIRQLKKEAGIKASKKDIFFGGVAEELNRDSIFENVSYHAVNIFYGFKTDDKNLKLKLDDQHDGFKWFSVKDKKIHKFAKYKIDELVKKYG